MTEEKDLGILKDVNLREIFTREDREFTPWLNENIDKLGEALGIGIIDTKTEFQIGSFYLDILGTLEGTDKKVIVENQIEPTDHVHLGQILTYASGVNASIIVWVSKQFRSEHISALEWLNKNSRENISFFGVEIKALKIDESKPALKFDVVVKPDEWERMTNVNKVTSETNLKYLKFYDKLVNTYNKENPQWFKKKPQPQSWLAFGAGKSGIIFAWSFKSKNRFSVELYIDTGDENENKRIFEGLENKKTEIESKLNQKLSWEALEKSRASRIALYKNIKGSIKELEEKDYDEIVIWAVENMSKFTKVMSEYISKLN